MVSRVSLLAAESLNGGFGIGDDHEAALPRRRRYESVRMLSAANYHLIIRISLEAQQHLPSSYEDELLKIRASFTPRYEKHHRPASRLEFMTRSGGAVQQPCFLTGSVAYLFILPALNDAFLLSSLGLFRSICSLSCCWRSLRPRCQL